MIVDFCRPYGTAVLDSGYHRPKQETPTDLGKVKAIIEKVGYRGLLPIETLGAGDPREKVARFREQVRAVFGV